MRGSHIADMKSFRKRAERGFTLVEVLVVLGIIGVLASILSIAVIQARRLSVRTQCQNNLRQIGSALQQIALDRSGAYPKLKDDKEIPWWAYVFGELSGKLSRLDRDPSADDLQLPGQLPNMMDILHCPTGGALDGSSPGNLDRSISYGLNFDVRDSDDKPYNFRDNANPYSSRFPDTLTVDDKKADKIHQADIKKHSAFILVSEADTQATDAVDYWTGAVHWTGGRISMAAITRDGSDEPPGNAPIVGRHSGYANVLFADLHVEALLALEGEGSPTNVNEDTGLWTLPNE